MASEYQPEAGQFIFGQPFQRYESGEMLDAAIRHIRSELDRVLWNRLQKDVGNPFDNTSATFETEGLAIHAYSWDESEDQPWNLKLGDIEVSWYKHSQRGTSVNKALSNDEIASFLSEALAIIRQCDIDFPGSKRSAWKPFTYCGEIHAETGWPE